MRGVSYSTRGRRGRHRGCWSLRRVLSPFFRLPVFLLALMRFNCSIGRWLVGLKCRVFSNTSAPGDIGPFLEMVYTILVDTDLTFIASGLSVSDALLLL